MNTDPAQLINSIGLAVDICGAALIFFNSPKISYNTYLYQHEELQQRQKKADRKYRFARVGLLLLVVGFSLQLGSNFL